MTIQERYLALKTLSDTELNQLVYLAIERGRNRAEVPMTRREREEQLIGFVWGQQMEGPPQTRESIRKNLGL